MEFEIAALADPEEIPRAPEFEILGSDVKSVVGFI